jgi:hypothetical protein
MGYRGPFQHSANTLAAIAVYLCLGASGIASADPPIMQAPVGQTPGAGTAEAGNITPSAAFQIGPLKVTLSGFIEATLLERTRNETADVGSSFSGIPFPNSPNYFVHEFRESARASLFRILMQAPLDGPNRLEGFFETDFLTVGTTSNGLESNSYPPRLRQVYAVWSRSDWGTYLLAGQSWSLATEFKQGLTPREENIPITAEGSYVVGLNWARQAQLRLVKSLGSKTFLGLSVEAPQNNIKGEAPAGTDATNAGGSLLNATTTYSVDVAPDIVLKLATDPGYGHYELYSLTRFLHTRSPATAGLLSTEQQNTATAQSFGGGFIIPLLPGQLDLHASALVGRGNGRYGASLLGDSTYNPTNGAPAPLHESQGLLRLVYHPNKLFDAYVYGGTEQSRAAYGLVPANNRACNVSFTQAATLPAGAGCGAVGSVREIAGGFYWKFYRGPLGYMTMGPEVEYVTDRTYIGRDGSMGRTNDTIVLWTTRYYPFQ